MGDFLALNNGCGQNILQLVSRGNAIIAELMRLKDYVPPIFRQADQRYNQIIIDFSYFKAADAYEHKIENESTLQELDEELRETFSDILTRFYLAFESVHKFVTDLNSFVDELEEGIYIQQSIETIMLSEEGKQLMCEAVYLYGVMLLLVDLHFEGPLREKLLVSYYRYNVQHSSTTRVDDVCVLLRSTGFTAAPTKRPANYPEGYFKRIPLNTLLVDLVISRLRSDEIYNQSSAFPYPEHRSMALANQAAMLVVALAFSPSTLQSQTSIMREVVDRFFPDNWVISIYMGLVLNLWDWWEPYKAAKNALSNTFESSNVKQTAQKYGQKLKKQIIDAQELQVSKRIEENAVGNTVKLVRDCNVTLHWILLHTSTPSILVEGTKRSRSTRQLVVQEAKYSAIDCLSLLLSTARLEQDVKQMYKQLLTDKETKWTRYKDICVERISDLAEVFSGNRPLDGVEKNECLRVWFKEIGKHVDSLQQDEGRKIVQLFQALEEVQEFHQLEHNLHISQYLADTREILQSMLRTGSITEDVMIALNIVTDCSYAWNIIESFISIMQDCIKKDPPMVIKLKPLFSKMASALETPLLRINQAHSSDLSSVSQYYSRELEAFARRVLQVIPETVFGLLAQIVSLETNNLKEIPLRLSKDKLREYAQLDDRLKVAKLTYTVSVFTEGVLALKSVSLGVLRVDSHQLLEDGIRQELIEKITLALHTGLTFDPKAKTSELLKKLEDLAVVIDGYRRSFQYIQDYININSLKIWQEEITFIINDAVEQECKGLIWVPGRRNLQKNKIILSNDSGSTNFMGRIVRELLRVTDPKSTVYIEHAIAWYDLKTQTEVLNHKIFSVILKAMGTPGLTGLDKLISFLTLSEIEKFINYLERFQDKTWTDVFGEFNSVNEIRDLSKAGKHYASISSRCGKTWPSILDWVLKIGHLQMLRKKIAYELNIACKFNAKQVESALQTFNNAILTEICGPKMVDQSDPDRKELLRNLSTRLNWAGMNDPYEKRYVNATKANNIEIMMFLFTISQLQKICYSRKLASLLSKKPQDPVDAVVLVIGIQTILNQCGPSTKEDYVSHLCQYILSFDISDGTKNAQVLEEECITGLIFLEEFAKYSNLPKSSILKHIPVILLDQYNTKIMNSSSHVVSLIMTRGVVFLVCIPTSNYEHELIFGVPIERGKFANSRQQNSAVVANPKLDLDMRHKRHPRDPLVVNKSKIDDEREMSDFISMETVLDELLKRLKVEHVVWCKDKGNLYYEVIFPIPSGDPCENCLHSLTELGIGVKMNSIVSVIPTQCTYNGMGNLLATKEVTKEYFEDKNAWKNFVESIRSKLTVQQVVDGVQSGGDLTFDYILLVLTADCLAGLGLVENSATNVVAAMLVSPLMGPVMSLTFGTIIADRHLQIIGLKSLLLGILVSIVYGFIFGLVLGTTEMPWGYGDWPTEEMKSRGNYRSLWMGVLWALPSGTGVAVALLQGSNGPLIGVAISASLLPPVVNCGLFWALGCIWLIYKPVKIPHIKGESYTDLNSSYAYVYTDYLPLEFFCNGIISACLTFVNVICIFITAIIVLKIKEVAAPYTSTPELRRFWEHDIRLVRGENNSRDTNNYSSMNSSYYDGFSPTKQRSLEHALNEAVQEAMDDKTFRNVQRFSYGQYAPEEVSQKLGSYSGNVGGLRTSGVPNNGSMTEDLAALDKLITLLLGQSNTLGNKRSSRSESWRHSLNSNRVRMSGRSGYHPLQTQTNLNTATHTTQAWMKKETNIQDLSDKSNFAMGKTSKTETLALAISAIKNLSQVRGSTSRDISNYLTRSQKLDKDVIRRQVRMSLKRGLAYGILKRDEGHYSICTEADDASREIASQEIALIDMCSRKCGAKSRGCKKIRKSRRSNNNCKRCGKSCPCGAGVCRNRKNKCNKGSGAPVKANTDRDADRLEVEVEELFGGSSRDFEKRR